MERGPEEYTPIHQKGKPLRVRRDWAGNGWCRKPNKKKERDRRTRHGSMAAACHGEENIQ